MINYSKTENYSISFQGKYEGFWGIKGFYLQPLKLAEGFSLDEKFERFSLEGCFPGGF